MLIILKLTKVGASFCKYWLSEALNFPIFILSPGDISIWISNFCKAIEQSVMVLTCLNSAITKSKNAYTFFLAIFYI